MKLSMKLEKNYEKRNQSRVEKIFRKFYFKFLESLYKIDKNFKIQMKLYGEIGRTLFSKFYFFSDKLFRSSFYNLLYDNCTFMHYIRVNNILES